jgi:2-polyprenyl-6-hydroxyphenyl methylase/3-demethylubiquinone-9 3-methyltransferase
MADTRDDTADAAHAPSVDPAEVARFSRMAAEWWNPNGKFRPLHRFNPVRLAYLKRELSRHFGRDAAGLRAFDGLRILDIGCGGGLVCEPMRRLGAGVVGIDPSRTNVEVARLHAAGSGLEIDYRATTAEELAAARERFDVVLALEVVEHVNDVPAFLQVAAGMVKPGGLMVVATINRTAKAFALAIVGAEYVLGWLPRGTHQYDRLVRPDEVEGPLRSAGLSVVERIGVTYNPLGGTWSESRDTDVNYMVLAARPG